MDVTSGSRLRRMRGHTIRVAVALAIALVSTAATPVTAGAIASPTVTYLALGDSLSFGFTQEKFNIHYPTESPSYFDEGFANFFLARLRSSTEIGKSAVLVNDGCPGETSNGLVGEGEALGGEKSTEGPGKPQGPGDWHPCAYHFVNGFALHNSLGTLSQLEEAISNLTALNPYTGKPNAVGAITVQVVSNDELAGIEECRNEVKQEFETKFSSFQPKPPAPGGTTYALNGTEPHDAEQQHQAFEVCILGKALYVAFPRIIKNVLNVITQLDGAGGYTGPVVVLDFYNPDSFVLPGSDFLQAVLNSELKRALEESGLTNAHWADVFAKFNKGRTATQEKESIRRYTEMCNPSVQEPQPGSPDPGCEGDVHPSLAGYRLMARVVNEAYLAPALP